MVICYKSNRKLTFLCMVGSLTNWALLTTGTMPLHSKSPQPKLKSNIFYPKFDGTYFLIFYLDYWNHHLWAWLPSFLLFSQTKYSFSHVFPPLPFQIILPSLLILHQSTKAAPDLRYFLDCWDESICSHALCPSGLLHLIWICVYHNLLHWLLCLHLPLDCQLLENRHPMLIQLYISST